MDRPLPQHRGRRRIAIGAGALAIVAALAAMAWHAPDAGSTQTVAADRITVAAVRRGAFDDFVALRAIAMPHTSVYLDAEEGGRVERVLVEDGARVTAGTPLAELSNASLQLEVLSREAQVAEQLNLLRSQELNLERNRLETQVRVAELEFRGKQLADAMTQQRALAERGFVNTSALQRTQDEVGLVGQLAQAARENQTATERLQAEQLRQLLASSLQLADHLRLARRHLQALQLRAPVAGQLTAFSLRVGQSVARGARVGQIDSPDQFKLVAGVDQFYLPRVAVGQAAALELDGATHALRVGRITPQVENGEFRIDLEFDNAAPRGLSRGQVVNARLTLGASTPALLLPAGPFLQDSGGAFVFVLDAAGTGAERRVVRMGRRNAQVVEVLEGLTEGERIVTSTYATFADRTRLRVRTGN